MTWTKERREEVKAYCEKATPGPWRWSMSGYSVKSSLDTEHDGDFLELVFSVPGGVMASKKAVAQFSNDAMFAIHARTDLPEAVLEIERLEGLLADALKDRERLQSTLQLIAGGLDECGTDFAPSREDAVMIAREALGIDAVKDSA